MVQRNGNGRIKGTPVRARNGWIVNAGVENIVEGRKGRIDVQAIYVEGGLNGVWIYDAGVDGKGQEGFKLPGDPDFLDELADALRLQAQDMRKKYGWE